MSNAAPFFATYCLFCFWDFVAAPLQFSLCTDLVQQLGWSREGVHNSFRGIAPRQPHPCVLGRAAWWGCFVAELKGICQNENALCGG